MGELKYHVTLWIAPASTQPWRRLGGMARKAWGRGEEGLGAGVLLTEDHRSVLIQPEERDPSEDFRSFQTILLLWSTVLTAANSKGLYTLKRKHLPKLRSYQAQVLVPFHLFQWMSHHFLISCWWPGLHQQPGKRREHRYFHWQKLLV